MYINQHNLESKICIKIFKKIFFMHHMQVTEKLGSYCATLDLGYDWLRKVKKQIKRFVFRGQEYILRSRQIKILHFFFNIPPFKLFNLYSWLCRDTFFLDHAYALFKIPITHSFMTWMLFDMLKNGTFFFNASHIQGQIVLTGNFSSEIHKYKEQFLCLRKKLYKYCMSTTKF